MPATTCQTCSNPLRDDARFCDSCGAPVPTDADNAEYKQITILFVDVVNSMGIAAALGAERLREVMAELIDRCTTVVRRYAGTLDKFTGDGVMALFGAPIALEDHALRSCLAALAIQSEIKELAERLQKSDGVELHIRIGLNSGEVIVGELGSSPFSFTAVGEHVGMAQRMQSAAAPDTVLLAESVAWLVDGAVVLGEREWVHIKGSADTVPARRLIAAKQRPDRAGRELTFVGRTRELDYVAGMLDGALAGGGGVLGVVGAPGIGKSRFVREMCAGATRRGMVDFTANCESHARAIPSHVLAALLRAVFDVNDSDLAVARQRVRDRTPDANADDLVLLDDLLGIGDPEISLPEIDPDARRRRLMQLLNAASLARSTPAVFVIEDVHWIDDVSESMLAGLVSVIPQTRSLVVFTYRPEYRGPLRDVVGSRTIALTPLDDSQTSAVVEELLGSHVSVSALAAQVADRAAGNPFFAEEIVRDLAERGVIDGRHGDYACAGDATVAHVPATLQATIAARIDRLGMPAKRTLSAAAVIGSRFGADLLDELVPSTVMAELIEAELVDQVMAVPRPEYCFRHPMIRTVAYESQLKSGRAKLHRRLAACIEESDLASADANAALIAEHLEAAGDLREAFAWRMRAGAWSATRDITAARMSWQVARGVADRLPADDRDRVAMQIAPRTLLCGTAWRAGGIATDNGFDELRQLTAAAGDKLSLAIGMAGLLSQLTMNGKFAESSFFATELAETLESIGDSTMTVGLLYGAIYAKGEAGEMAECQRLAQRVIDLADGDPAKGNLVLGSPLALATIARGVSRCALGVPGWRDDLAEGITMARPFDPMSRALVVTYKYAYGITTGALVADATAMTETAEALEVAEESGDDVTLWMAQVTRGMTLIHHTDRYRAAGFELLTRSRESAAHELSNVMGVMMIDVHLAWELLRRGDIEVALELSRAVIEDQVATGEFLYRGRATTVLVESLLARGGEADLAEAELAIERLAAVPTEPRYVVFKVALSRLRALLARARGDEPRYRSLLAEHRNLVESCGFEQYMEGATSPKLR
jgi:adenylate cyclase